MTLRGTPRLACAIAFLGASLACGHPAADKARPAEGPAPAAASDEDAVRAYVFPREVERPALPHGLETSRVTRVLQNELLPTIDPQDLESACNLVRFYRLRSVLPALRPFLTASASDTDSARRVLIVARAFAELGAPMLREEAAQEFADLLASEAARDPEVALELRRTLKYLPAPRRALARLVSVRVADAPENQDLSVLEAARSYRESTFAIAADEERAQALADLFAGLVDRYSSLFREESGYTLIWEAERSGAATVAAALHASFGRLPADARAERSKVALAITHFGGTLTAEEQALAPAGQTFQP